jgi:hypothetical protein
LFGEPGVKAPWWIGLKCNSASGFLLSFWMKKSKVLKITYCILCANQQKKLHVCCNNLKLK